MLADVCAEPSFSVYSMIRGIEVVSVSDSRDREERILPCVDSGGGGENNADGTMPRDQKTNSQLR